MSCYTNYTYTLHIYTCTDMRVPREKKKTTATTTTAQFFHVSFPCACDADTLVLSLLVFFFVLRQRFIVGAKKIWRRLVTCVRYVYCECRWALQRGTKVTLQLLCCAPVSTTLFGTSTDTLLNTTAHRTTPLCLPSFERAKKDPNFCCLFCSSCLNKCTCQS